MAIAFAAIFALLLLFVAFIAFAAPADARRIVCERRAAERNQGRIA